jgi:hypothetical protein
MTTTREYDQAGTGGAIAARLTSESLARATRPVRGGGTPPTGSRGRAAWYADGGRLYVAVASDSWKPGISGPAGWCGDRTGPAGRPLSLLLPIPPATVSHGTAVVHPAGPVADHAVPQQLASLLPPERQATSCIIEILPEGQFMVYGLGVPLARMRSTAAARARVPVGSAAARVSGSARR